MGKKKKKPKKNHHQTTTKRGGLGEITVKKRGAPPKGGWGRQGAGSQAEPPPGIGQLTLGKNKRRAAAAPRPRALRPLVLPPPPRRGHPAPRPPLRPQPRGDVRPSPARERRLPGMAQPSGGRETQRRREEAGGSAGAGPTSCRPGGAALPLPEPSGGAEPNRAEPSRAPPVPGAPRPGSGYRSRSQCGAAQRLRTADQLNLPVKNLYSSICPLSDLRGKSSLFEDYAALHNAGFWQYNRAIQFVHSPPCVLMEGFILCPQSLFILCPETASEILKCTNLFESLTDIQRITMIVPGKLFSMPENRSSKRYKQCPLKTVRKSSIQTGEQGSCRSALEAES
ncbi:translation initiation factor IF-2-like [Cuculus canorus]|uniref:translation initiation factor IF-2-like n=1 Tax=Cuculus canorus TaxID=55661 RepID=UPI0023AAE5C1|nr:translation initiation factor IF-2-like [Cuculus canorus]